MAEKKQYDAFVAHASEDKDAFVRPLATSLHNLGVEIWYDEFSLKVGDSLSRSIDKGLASSRYGIVVISPAFLSKRWPERELQGLVAKEVAQADGEVILPVWHGVTREQVLEFSPTLADRFALDTRDAGAEQIALRLLEVIRPDVYKSHRLVELRGLASGEAMDSLRSEIAESRAELEGVQEKLSEFQCPVCGSELESKSVVGPDGEDYWLEHFHCGYEATDGRMSRPCPYDEKYPNSEDYEPEATQTARGEWLCFAKPKTYTAHLIEIRYGSGPTREAAEADIRGRMPRRRSPSRD